MPRPTTEYDIKGVTTYNSMIALDGSKKAFCSGCGGPREVAYAETNPCFCCGATGTQKTQPVFDDFGELVPAEVVAQQREVANAERTARLVAANAARREKAAPAPAPAKAVKAAAIPAKPVTKPKPVAAVRPTQTVQAKPAATSKKDRQAQAAARLAALL